MSETTYLYGKHTLEALIQNAPKRVMKLLIAEDGLKRGDQRLHALMDLAKQQGVHVQVSPKAKLDTMIDDPTIHHQGVVGVVTPKPLLELDELIALCKPELSNNQPCTILMLDEITDPRNFGAILRVADAAGIKGVIIGKHRSALLTPAAMKTASGAEETVNLVSVTNLVQAIETLKKAGFWVVGSMLSDQATPHHKQDFKMPTVLIMGSEDKGLRPLVQKNCDFQVYIPMHGQVQSLNVATATAVLLFKIAEHQKSF